ncbi:protein of unknown function DUF4236 [Gottschalkia purinilytica]|uniref:DUF4236 domain-containing protein n=1 Tax=Gottschalkia purinilytica TaxID=1503 RepID=A0A0L0WAJ9_GOTPU|nr:DUF4236 domain-containing protein [Gottschalkia purinilytica]KNF08521.1 protein of unknown function DUF4236 [Gottschalkia purinilytica]
MGFRFRKSFKIAPGVKINIGKKSTSLSLGGKGARYTISSTGRKTTTVGIPGTGISYSQSSSSKSRSNIEKQRLRENEHKLKELEREMVLLEAEYEVEEYNEHINLITSIHKDYIEFWDWKSINSKPIPFEPGTKGPNELEAIKKLEIYKSNLLAKIFKFIEKRKIEELKSDIVSAKEKDNELLSSWEHLNKLSSSILSKDLDSYLAVLDEVNPLYNLLDYIDYFEFYAIDEYTMIVDFNIIIDDVVPQQSKSLTKTGKLSVRNLTKTNYYSLVQDHVCSCVICIARHLFALLPLETVIINTQYEILNTETGHEESSTILSVKIDKDKLNSLNLDLIDPSDSINNFEHNMKFLKTKGFQPIDKISL